MSNESTNLQSELAELEKIKRRGVLEGWLPDGSRVKYFSMKELDKAIADTRAQINGTSGMMAASQNVIHPSHSRGYE